MSGDAATASGGAAGLGWTGGGAGDGGGDAATATDFSGGGTPDECGVAQSSSSKLATQRPSSQPYSRLMMAMHVGGRLADRG